jgi:hypothetical protein
MASQVVLPVNAAVPSVLWVYAEHFALPRRVDYIGR